MKKMMLNKMILKKIMLLVVLGLLFTVFAYTASASAFETNISQIKQYVTNSMYADIQIEKLRYEPYPVNPGEYFDLAIKAENMGGALTNKLIFELIPKYPFTLDSDEHAVKEYGRLESQEPVILEYRLRVDKNAVEGTNEIDFRYTPDGNVESPAWAYETFEIKVENVQTDFDVVLQESTGTDVSVAVANIGKNVANSVIIKIPEQEFFEPAETSAQMVGNLENGDYTLVSFKINPKKIRPVKSETTQAKSETVKSDSGSLSGSPGKKMLKLQIDYTDTLGERRSVVKEIPFGNGAFASGTVQGATSTASPGSPGNFQRNGAAVPAETKLYQRFWVWLIILAVFLAVWKLYKVLKRRKEEKEEKKHRAKA